MSDPFNTFPSQPFPGQAGMPQPMGGGLPQPGMYEAAEEPSAKKGKKRKRGGDKGGDSAVTRKVASRNRLLGIALAALTGLLVIGGLAATRTQETYVIRTTGPITALATITADNVQADPVPVALIEDGALSGEDPRALLEEFLVAVDGKVTISPLAKGEQVHLEDFSVEVGLDTVVGPNERLMAIEAEVTDAVAGVIRPGSTVDVVASVAGSTNVVASGVPVVSIRPNSQYYQNISSSQDADKNPDELLPGAPVPGMYIVRVDAQTAVDLSAAMAVSERTTLVLRGSGSEDVLTAPADLEQLICRGDSACADRLRDYGTSGDGAAAAVPADALVGEIPAEPAG